MEAVQNKIHPSTALGADCFPVADIRELYASYDAQAAVGSN